MEGGRSTILVVDDEPSVRAAISDYLSREGYHMLEAGDGVAMRRMLDENDVSVVLLDVMLPGENGLSLAQSLAHRDDIGVIMISALGAEGDRIAGLERGADDYLPKPVSPRELLARIRALQRRFKGPNSPGGLQFEFAGWRLDAVRRVLRDARGVVTTLSDGEFGLLLAFVEHPQRVLSRDELLGLARGNDSDAYDRAIDTQVSRIRHKLRTPTSGELIRTIRGEGYIFTPEVIALNSAEPVRQNPNPACAPDRGIRIDTSACEASISGMALDLTYSEVTIFAALYEAKNTVVTKDALSRQALSRPWQAFDRSIDVHVSNLRNKLSLHAGISIVTVRKVGYKLVVE